MTIPELHRLFLNSNGICTDTRKIANNDLFIALKGDSFNGNAFASEALEKGAGKALIDDPEFQRGTDTIMVEDCLQTLQKLAKYHRNYLKVPILALTGSNGKTTTKELINIVLKTTYQTSATKGNLNNHIGVPLTLLQMDAETELGIVEMGANHPGEIAMLCEIAQPDYGYITNFGKAHLEGFGSLEGVIKAKSELYQYLRQHEKLVFVNGDDPLQVQATDDMERIIFNGNGASNEKIRLEDASTELVLNYEGLTIQSHLIGKYNFSNIAAAITIGAYFSVPAIFIKKAIELYIPANNRSQILEKGGFRIIMDAYNANPTSMAAAIDNFKQVEGASKIAILGDMFEVGKDAAREHQQVLDILEEDNAISECYLIGKQFAECHAKNESVRVFDSFEKFAGYLEEHHLQPPAFILIKGSRGMALERVLPLLE